jgi:hypothetical protein
LARLVPAWQNADEERRDALMFLCLTCKSDEACLNFMALKEDANFRLPCPQEGCPGELLHLDDGIAEAVVILNEKGYTTVDSCSGHFNNASDLLTFYAHFAKDCSPASEPPDGFELVPGQATGNNGDSIWYFSSGDTLDANAEFADFLTFREGNRTLQILEVNRRFLEWALTLPASLSDAKAGADES